VAKLYRDENSSQRQVTFFLEIEYLKAQVFFSRYKKIDLFFEETFCDRELMNKVPILPKTTKLASLTHDPDKLFFQFLRSGKITKAPNSFKLNLIYYLPRQYAAFPSVIGFSVVKLNELSNYIIQHINGTRTCSEIADEIASVVKASQRPFFHDAIKKNLRKLIYSGILMLAGECS
jgi:hypothetical protein